MKLTAEEFINELRKAPEWALGKDGDILILCVWENGEMKKYTGPDPLDVGTELDYVHFVVRVRDVIDNPEVRNRRLR
jgi:hypothetical protein